MSSQPIQELASVTRSLRKSSCSHGRVRFFTHHTTNANHVILLLQCHTLQAISSKASPIPSVSTAAARPSSAREVVLKYYELYNARDIIHGVGSLIAEDCVYEDLVYQDPFVGKESIHEYLEKVAAWIPADLKFVIEDVSDGKESAGVVWHVEFDGGIVLPFSRGVSFYRVNDKGQIIYGRDIVEPAFKAGSGALKAISIVAPIIKKLGPAANPALLPSLALWAFYAGYVSVVMLSPWPPGDPAWQTSMDTITTLMHESLNFFYINIGLDQLGMAPVPNVAEHPVSEALFNFINAWSLMFLPVMLMDRRRVDNKVGLWIGTMMLTNIFLPIYMAKRLAPEASIVEEYGDSRDQKPCIVLSRLTGTVAALIGTVSIAWALAARPEFGTLGDRWLWFTNQIASNRVDWAFALDALLYSVWQYVLLSSCGARHTHRSIPFFGMAAWLIAGSPTVENKDTNKSRQLRA